MSKKTESCSKCGSPKAITKNGTSLKYCRPCHNANCAKWTAKNLDRRREIGRIGAKAWRSQNHEKVLAHKRRPETKEKSSLFFKEWSRRPEVAERLSLKSRNVRGRKMTGNVVSLTEWKHRLEEFDHRCAYCLKKERALDMDHLEAISVGGSHEIENIVPACRPCNSAKQSRGILSILNRKAG